MSSCLTTVAQRPDDVFDNKYEIYRRKVDELTIQRRDGLGAGYYESNICYGLVQHIHLLLKYCKAEYTVQNAVRAQSR